MTPKEIAGRLRQALADNEPAGTINCDALWELADELDPPLPEPGTVVWWRLPHGGAWRTGIVCPGGGRRLHIQGGSLGMEDMAFVEWKPARILAPDEVAVKVPPMDEWPSGCDAITWIYQFESKYDHNEPIITRAEAEEMHRE